MKQDMTNISKKIEDDLANLSKSNGIYYLARNLSLKRTDAEKLYNIWRKEYVSNNGNTRNNRKGI